MYISDTLYGKHNQKTSYLKSHPRTSNPQKQFRTSLFSTLLFPIGEGKVICQRQRNHNNSEYSYENVSIPK